MITIENYRREKLRMVISYPMGAMNLNALGKYEIQEGKRFFKFFTKWKTIKIIRQVEPSERRDMNFGRAKHDLFKIAKERF